MISLLLATDYVSVFPIIVCVLGILPVRIPTQQSLGSIVNFQRGLGWSTTQKQAVVVNIVVILLLEVLLCALYVLIQGKVKKTKKFAEMKRMISLKDTRM